MNRAFFLDRDGTLNEAVYRFEPEYDRPMDCAPIEVQDFKINPGAKELVDYIKSRGFIPIVVTNQTDFIKKNIPLVNYEEITHELCRALDLERGQVFECLHKPGFSLECLCRKPKPGLFLMAKGIYDLDLPNSWMLGDSGTDISAAKNAGVKNTIYLKRKKLEGLQEGNEEDFKKMQEKAWFPEHYIDSLNEVRRLL